MTFGQHRRAVGVFPTRSEAEHALNELKRSGFSMERVSIVARDAERQDDIAGVDVSDRSDVGNQADEGAASGALTGGALGGITGLLIGLGTLAIPGVGPIMLAGELATTLATAVAGSAIGVAAGGLLGGLIGLGIPEERARVYNDRVSRGKYLVILIGTDEEIAIAETLLGDRGVQDWGIYNAPDVDATRSNYAKPVVPVTNTTHTGYTTTPVVDTTRTIKPNRVVENDPNISIIDRRDEV